MFFFFIEYESVSRTAHIKMKIGRFVHLNEDLIQNYEKLSFLIRWYFSVNEDCFWKVFFRRIFLFRSVLYEHFSLMSSCFFKKNSYIIRPNSFVNSLKYFLFLLSCLNYIINDVIFLF